MLDRVLSMFSTDGFMPHGHCYLWQPSLIWLHAISDGLIALAYTSIPFTLVHFVRRRRDLPFDALFVCFSVFILACGATHLAEVWTLWNPTYWLSGSLKALTAVASITTAVVLAKQMPRALAIPTPAALAAAHAELSRANQALETRVAERTTELTRKNSELAAEVQERKRVESALRRSESRFRCLSEAGILGIITGDLQGRILEANDTFLEMVGFTQADLATGRVRWDAMTPPEYAERDRQEVEILKRGGIMNTWRKEYIRRDGERVPVLIGGALLEGDENQCVSFVLDLTEQQRTEAILHDLRREHAADARFRALLDAAPDAIVVTSSDGRITLVNTRAEAVFGYAREELIGRPIEILMPERFRRGYEQHVSSYLAAPSTRLMSPEIELYGRRKDGSEVPLEISLSPLAGEDGVTVSASIRDISERRRMENATRLLAERLTSAVESMQDAFALFDGDMRLVLCNSAYQRLIGQVVDGPLIGRTFAELEEACVELMEISTDEDRERLRRAPLCHAPTDAASAADVRLRDGRRLRVIDRRTPEGGLVKTIWDLTEDLRLAEELQAARISAEAASRAKSEFLSSMSHELRTPMNAVLGFAQLLQRDKKQPLAEKHRSYVTQILRGGEHLLRLIDDVLDLSRIEAGKIMVELEPLDVSRLLGQVHDTLEPLAAERNIELELTPPPDDLPPVSADPTRLAQVLINFGSNGIKYNRPGGKVLVSATRSGANVRVSVRDTGHGIPLEHHATLFQPFQRAGQEAGPIEGTGVGLFLSKRLAALMNGSVGFHSVPDEGSEFWIEVPISVARGTTVKTTSEEVTREQPSSSSSSRLILYVEDNLANVALMRDLVGTLDGVELLVSPTAEEGIALARSRHPHVILMDINLPGMNGFEALGALRAAEDTRSIPVIALTAAASPRERQRGIDAGFRDYVTKPIRVDALVSVLEELLPLNG